MNTRSDTRRRIQEVALDMFAEQGYDKTSLREIAEQLGVTKAALYYHFKTKEEIVSSILQAADEGLEKLVEWTKDHEPTPANRRELIRLYATSLRDGRAFQTMRLIQENQHSLRELAGRMRSRERMEELTKFLVDPDAPLTTLLKTKMSLMVMHFGMFALKDTAASTEEAYAASLQVATELLDSSGH